jgi:hypothetical protein
LIFSASSSRISSGDHISLGTCNWL